jgi:hypothetical protein
MTAAMQRPALEVAEIIRQHGAGFLARYGSVLSAVQRQALHDLAVCRTAALGGHIEHCLDCGAQRIAYNSCRNRHCPKCQALARARWLEQQAQHLLPVEYHHVVFTLPAPLSELALANPAVVYDLLLRSVAATLREVAADPKHLGATLGVLLVLHTWGQNLHHHPHVHGVVTGGGLSCDRRGKVEALPRWRACRPGFFLPVRILSRVFRGKFVAGLRRVWAAGRLRLPGALAALAEPDGRAAWYRSLYAHEWVVYAKPPFGGPERVLKYLARYSHRVAISNARLQQLQEGQVRFDYHDYADGGRPKTMTLSAEEFLRRLLQHVLPRGFVKVRHSGLLANNQREARLRVCRRLLLVVNAAGGMAKEDSRAVAPASQRCCQCCGGTRLVYRALPAEGAELEGGSARSDSS